MNKEKSKSIVDRKGFVVLAATFGAVVFVMGSVLVFRLGNWSSDQDLASSPVTLLLQDATKAFMEKDFEKSRKIYEAILARDPANYDANRLLATILVQDTQPPEYDKALVLLEKALKVNRAYRELSAYGQLLSVNRRYPESEAILKECLKENPKDDKDWCWLGHALRMQHRKAEALIALKKALDLDPKSDKAQKEMEIVNQMQ
jgi:tetratricopeptide (TPR) repeat protein